MTVDASPSFKRYPYTGLGGYSFTFQTYKDEDLSVVYLGTSGQPLLLVKDIDYRVTLSPDFSSGEVVILETDTTRSLVDGSLTISRELLFEQGVKFINNHALPMGVVEVSFDRLVMMIQQLNTVVSEGTIIINWRGDWVPGVEYSTQDLVVFTNGNWYVCVTEHTSTAFLDDLALGYWIIALNVDEVAVLTDKAEAAAIAAEAAEGGAADSETQSGLSEVNAEEAAQEAANCRQEAYDNSVTAAAAADRAEAAANVIPDPIGEDPGDTVRVNATSDGWIFSPLVGMEPDLGAPASEGMILSSTTAKVRSWIPSYSGLSVPSGATLTGGVIGGDYEKTGDHTIQVKAVSCFDSTNTIKLTGATQTVTVPSVIDEVYNLFICDDGTIRTDTDVGGSNLSGSYDIRWIGFATNSSTGVLLYVSSVAGRVTLYEAVLMQSPIPITFTQIDISAFAPLERCGRISIITGAPQTEDSAVNLSFDGTTQAYGSLILGGGISCYHGMYLRAFDISHDAFNVVLQIIETLR